MSKKKFKKGLDVLFDVAKVVESEEVVFFEKQHISEKTTQKKKRPKSSTRKNFTSDIDALLLTAMGEDSPKSSKQHKTTDSKARNHQVKGLNALIRQTLDPEFYNIGESKKRVSFIYDKKKYQRLKDIAKTENAYLKNIIGRILSDFIEGYENNALS